MPEFKQTDIQNIRHLRNAYFYEVEISQELFIESMIQNSSCYKILENSIEIGYFIVNEDNIILEFYLITEALNRKESIFNKIIKEFSIKKIYCKSFDHVLLTCSHTFAKSSRIIRVIFRDYINGLNVDFDSRIRVQLASVSDIPKLLEYDSENHKTDKQLKEIISNNLLHVFMSNKSFLGYGYLTKVIADKNYHDIGVWTNPEFREKGYGSMIISYMKRYCFSHSYIPVCGCDVTNIAARKVFQKNGFISKNCIIEFII